MISRFQYLKRGITSAQFRFPDRCAAVFGTTHAFTVPSKTAPNIGDNASAVGCFLRNAALSARFAGGRLRQCTARKTTNAFNDRRAFRRRGSGGRFFIVKTVSVYYALRSENRNEKKNVSTKVHSNRTFDPNSRALSVGSSETLRGSTVRSPLDPSGRTIFKKFYLFFRSKSTGFSKRISSTSFPTTVEKFFVLLRVLYVSIAENDRHECVKSKESGRSKRRNS